MAISKPSVAGHIGGFFALLLKQEEERDNLCGRFNLCWKATKHLLKKTVETNFFTKTQDMHVKKNPNPYKINAGQFISVSPLQHNVACTLIKGKDYTKMEIQANYPPGST